MLRDPGKWLEDIVSEGKDALEFLQDKSEEDYVTDKALRAMVERKLFVVGEAVTQLKNSYASVASALPDVREIVGFRNLLAHGYFALDHRRVFNIATTSLKPLLDAAEEALKSYP